MFRWFLVNIFKSERERELLCEIDNVVVLVQPENVSLLLGEYYLEWERERASGERSLNRDCGESNEEKLRGSSGGKLWTEIVVKATKKNWEAAVERSLNRDFELWRRKIFSSAEEEKKEKGKKTKGERNEQQKKKSNLFIAKIFIYFLYLRYTVARTRREVDARCSQRKKKEERMDKVWSFFLV